jgi:GNAT superfamily N-acetyltransferase
MDMESGYVYETTFSDLVFRSVNPSDQDQLKAIHDDLFPVKYSDRFFTEAVNGRGLKGGELFTVMAVKVDAMSGFETIVGFLMGQYLRSSNCDDAFDLFEGGQESREVFYILTLGLVRSYRRCGLGSDLVRRSVEHARRNSDCGAVSTPDSTSLSSFAPFSNWLFAADRCTCTSLVTTCRRSTSMRRTASSVCER